MAQGRGFPRRQFPTRSRRLTAWGVGPESPGQTVNSTTPILWTSGSVLSSGGEQVTIVRIRGDLTLVLDTVSAALSGFAGAVGIGIVTTAAFTAGVGSIPTPITEEDWDGWMWHTYFTLRSVTATVADGANAVTNVLRVPIDTKAMRKQTSDMTLFGAIEASNEFGTASMSIVANSRVLDKLS